MYDIVWMQIVNGRKDLPSDKLCIPFVHGPLLIHSPLGEIIEERTFFHVLLSKAIVPVIMDQLVDVHDIWVLDLLQDTYLILEQMLKNFNPLHLFLSYYF